MTVGEIEQRMSAVEFGEWVAVYRIEAQEQEREATARRLQADASARADRALRG